MGRRLEKGRTAVAALVAGIEAAAGYFLVLKFRWALIANAVFSAVLFVVILFTDAAAEYKLLGAILLFILPVLSPIAISALIISIKKSRKHSKIVKAGFDGAELVPNDERFFDLFLSTLERAERRIFIDFYMVKPGKIWESVKNIAVEKVESGVQVGIIYDGFGSANLPKKQRKWLISHKIRCVCFNPLWPRPNLFVLCRDHRKLAVVDDKLFIGGINLADEYANDPSPFGVWRDCGAVFDGGIADIVAENIKKTLKIKSISQKEQNGRENVGKEAGELYFDEPFSCAALKNIFAELLMKKDEIRIATPYLVPDKATEDLIKCALFRGKTVKIYLPGVPDKRFVRAASMEYARELSRYGAEVYIFSPGFLHAKLCLAGDVAVIGSGNLDCRSFYLQRECGVATACEPFVGAVRSELDELESKCERATFGKCHAVRAALRLGFFRILSPLL